MASSMGDFDMVDIDLMAVKGSLKRITILAAGPMAQNESKHVHCDCRLPHLYLRKSSIGYRVFNQ